MLPNLSRDLKADLVTRGFSRRNLVRMTTLLGAGATLPFYNEPALAQLSSLGRLPPDAVKINANENPLGLWQPGNRSWRERFSAGFHSPF